LPTPTSLLSISGISNSPIQFLVTGGARYWLKVIPNGGNPSPANLTLTIYCAPNLSVPAGAIAVNDDSAGFPLVYASGTADYTVLKFQDDFPSGEAGDPP
jgi:hypothetical protein